MSSPPTTTWPSVGVRRPPAIDRSVVFPEPEGPEEHDDLVVAHGEGGVVERDDLVLSRAVDLADVSEVERRHELLLVQAPPPMAVAGSIRMIRRSEIALPSERGAEYAREGEQRPVRGGAAGGCPAGRIAASPKARMAPTTNAIVAVTRSLGEQTTGEAAATTLRSP